MGGLMGVSWARRRRSPAALALDGNAVAIARMARRLLESLLLRWPPKKAVIGLRVFGEFLTVNHAGFETDLDKRQPAE